MVMSDANPFHASWSNSSNEDFLGAASAGVGTASLASNSNTANGAPRNNITGIGMRQFSFGNDYAMSNGNGNGNGGRRGSNEIEAGNAETVLDGNNSITFDGNLHAARITRASSMGISSGEGIGALAGRPHSDNVHRHSASFASLPVSMSRPDPISRVSSVQSRSSSIGAYYNGISSVIHDTARVAGWSKVKELCASNPEAAGYISPVGGTALHHVCSRRCPYADVAEVLIKAYPDALLKIDEKEWTPLHYACRFKAPVDVVRLLVDLYPHFGHKSVSWLDRQGRSPLYYAIRYDAPPGVVGILLEVDPSVVLNEDQSADSPLSLVWTRWAEKTDGKATLQRIIYPRGDSQDLSPTARADQVMRRLKMQSAVYKRWKRADMLLKAAFGFPVDDNGDDDEEGSTPRREPVRVNTRTWRILHATSAIRCHMSLFNLACALYPEQATEFDNRDLQWPDDLAPNFRSATKLTALHLAAASPVNGETKKQILLQLLKMNPGAAHAKASDGRLPLHFMAQNPQCPHWTLDGAIDLYLANTSAVSDCDLEGQLPLHRSASVEHDAPDEDVVSAGNDQSPYSTMRILLNLFPDGASHQDNTGCYPIHHVAISGKMWDDDVEAIYNAYPEAIRVRCGVSLYKRLPLHLAVSNPAADLSLIERVLNAHVSAISRADHQGKLPLHIACEAGLSWDKGSQLLYDAFPSALEQREGNARRWTALHMACDSPHTGPNLIGKLVEKHPESAGVADNDDRYPFHLACASGKSWTAGLDALFLAFPDALRCPDRSGLLPFHIASMNFSSDKPLALSSQHKYRKAYRSASIESELKKIQEAENLNATGLLFQLLKADPSIL